MKIYKTALYLRLSVGGGRGFEEDSIVNQRQIIESYLNNSDEFEVVSEHIDEGASGLIFERKAFLEMMDKAKQGDIDCIIVRDLSRFGRDYIEIGRHLQSVLPVMGIRFISVLDNIDTASISENEEMLMKLKLLINDAYSRDISVKTRKSLKVMRDKGLYVGAMPVYGYKKSEHNRHQLEIDEVTAPIVQEIYNLKIQGYSLNKIMDYLNESNIPSPLQYKIIKKMPFSKNGFANTENPKWSATTILRILKDEIYTGTLAQGKVSNINYKLKVPIKRAYEDVSRVAHSHVSIISKNDFELVQRVLKIKTKATQNNKVPHLLSGLVICSSCGNNMTIKTVRITDKCYRYYYCPAGKKNGCLSPKMIRVEKLEQEVFRQIREYVQEMKKYRDKLKTMSFTDIKREFTKEHYAKLNELYVTCDQINLYQRSLSKSLVDGVINAEEYTELLKRYEVDAIDLNGEINVLKCVIDDAEDNVENRLRFIEDICKIDDSKTAVKSSILKVVEKITISSGSVKIINTIM